MLRIRISVLLAHVERRGSNMHEHEEKELDV